MLGISFCHKKNVVHRDIKLENILLDENNKIRIIDFGFSIQIPKTRKLNIFCGTPSYMAPEITKKQEYIGHLVDIWALGILLYCMLAGNFPFKGIQFFLGICCHNDIGKDDNDLFRRIASGIFEIPHYFSPCTKSLLMRILRVDPSQRPSCDEILADFWMLKDIKPSGESNGQ